MFFGGHCHSLLALQIPKGRGFGTYIIFVWESERLFNSGRVMECERSGWLNSKLVWIIEWKGDDGGTIIKDLGLKEGEKINGLVKK